VLRIAAAIILLAIYTTPAGAVITCHAKNGSDGHWSWRQVDGKKCWYKGKRNVSKSELRWVQQHNASRPVPPPIRSVPPLSIWVIPAAWIEAAERERMNEEADAVTYEPPLPRYPDDPDEASVWPMHVWKQQQPDINTKRILIFLLIIQSVILAVVVGKLVVMKWA
jgi:hypothetical protein